MSSKSRWWTFQLSAAAEKSLQKRDYCADLIIAYLQSLIGHGARPVNRAHGDLSAFGLANRGSYDIPGSDTTVITPEDFKRLSQLRFAEILTRNTAWPVIRPMQTRELPPDRRSEVIDAHIKKSMKQIEEYLYPYFQDSSTDWYLFDRYAFACNRDTRDTETQWQKKIQERFLPIALISRIIDRVMPNHDVTLHIGCWTEKTNDFDSLFGQTEVLRILDSYRERRRTKITLKIYNSGTEDKHNNHERLFLGEHWGLHMGEGLSELYHAMAHDTPSQKSLRSLSIFKWNDSGDRPVGPNGMLETELIDRVALANVAWCKKQTSAQYELPLL